MGINGRKILLLNEIYVLNEIVISLLQYQSINEYILNFAVWKNIYFSNILYLYMNSFTYKLLTIHPFEAFNDTARLLFMVDSKNFPALRSQNNIIPIPVPIVSILPLNDTDRIPQPLLREGIFLIFYETLKWFCNLNG